MSKDTSGKVQLDWVAEFRERFVGETEPHFTDWLTPSNGKKIERFISRELTKAYQEGEKAGKEEVTSKITRIIANTNKGDILSNPVIIGNKIIKYLSKLKESEQVVNTKEK